MKTNQLLHRSLALLLFVAFSMVLLPKHIFADHHHASIICHETQEHIEEVEAECELCDFVLPAATVQFFFFQPKSNYYIASENLFEQAFFPLYYYKRTHPLRGPPISKTTFSSFPSQTGI